MQKEPLTITCTVQEMIFLAKLLGADTLLGLDDPFRGWLAEEIEETWKIVQTTLEERKFIKAQSDGGIVMDIAVAALIGTCAFPEASFTVTSTSADGKTVNTILHLTSQLAVEQTLVAESPATYQLTTLEDSKAVYHRILQLMALGEQQAAPSSKGELPEADLTQAREAIKDGRITEAQKLLQDAGLPKAMATVLTETFLTTVNNNTLLALSNRDGNWKMAGLGLLSGKNGMWRLRAFARQGKTWVELLPCNAEEARNAIRRTMNRVLLERI